MNICTKYQLMEAWIKKVIVLAAYSSYKSEMCYV